MKEKNLRKMIRETIVDIIIEKKKKNQNIKYGIWPGYMGLHHHDDDDNDSTDSFDGGDGGGE